jgi:hypothetical protein
MNAISTEWYLLAGRSADSDLQEASMHLDPAYIDPGSGSLIIQAVIATLVAIPLFFRTHIARAAATFRGRGSNEETPSPVDGSDKTN